MLLTKEAVCLSSYVLVLVLAEYRGSNGDAATESGWSASECEDESSGTTPPPNSRLLPPLLVDLGPAAKLMGEGAPPEPSRVPGLNLAPFPMATLLSALTPVALPERDDGCCWC